MIRESARQYYRAALIAQTASSVLEACGYRAKAHYDAHYDVILPPLALAAGLGEMGRNNILIADRHGSRIRIGAVTTDAPVEYDRAVSLGADSFCSICRKCADSCPPRALSFDDKQTIRGAAKWPTHAEHCYAYWRKAGSDCGICMAVCPYSHRSTRIHNALRRLVRRTRIFNRILLRLDDLVYGRDWKSRMARQVPSPNP
jgi:epoxyqueuosine reductase QueG